jgi:hypothetical protein
MVAGNGMLTLGVNGDGFIALRPAPGGTVSLFRIAGHQALVDYSMGSVFSYQGSPAVLLYRDSFFVDPVLPALEKRAFALSSEQGRVQGLDLAALAMPDAREGWDVDALFHGQDGFWYYRAVRSSGEQTGRAYYRTQDLSSSGEPITAGAFRNAQSPQPAGQAGDLLGRALKSCAAELIPGQSAVVAVLAQTAASPRTYWLGQDPGSASMESGGSAGVLQLWAYEDSESALAIFPDGRGYRVVAGMNPAPSSFRLPGLPKNFVYTGIALLGSRIVASWEEQDSWAVGAAGFVLVP